MTPRSPPIFPPRVSTQPKEERPVMPNDPFIDVGDLRSLGPLRYLDVRDQAAFDAGHVPGDRPCRRAGYERKEARARG